MLCGVYEADSETEAAGLIEDFVHRWSEFPIPEFRTVLKVLVEWLPEILAFHREGRNNKLGVLKRIAY